MRPLHLIALISSVLAIACDGPLPIVDGGGDAEVDASAPFVDAGVDAYVPPPDVCEELGLPRATMQSGTGAAFDEVAGDFTVNTLDGPWTLSDHWSGCESYVFINYANTDYGNPLFESYPDGLFVNGPKNVHYFFGSYETDSSAIRARMQPIRDGLEEGFAVYELSEEDRAYWRSHLHFVVDPIQNATGSVGDFVRAEATVQHTFGITRDQRFDPVGSLYTFSSAGTRPDFGNAAYAPHYDNYLASLREQLAAENDVTVVSVIDEADVTQRVLDRTVALPDAPTMATFDTLKVDVEVHCRQDPAHCSEWDRIADIRVCSDETCTASSELVRWITPYSRPGRRRWVIDASPLLGLLAAGGDTLLRVTMGPDWETATPRDVNISLRLSRRDTSAPIPSQAVLAYTGGPFDATYNTSHPPFTFTPPAGTTKVELVAIVSGHGMAAGNNCAEWCNHEHTFTVNGGSSHRIDFPGEAGQPLGCAARASEGVVPNQWGNWALGRAGWCPGLPVAARVFDISSETNVGEPNSLEYLASFMGRDPPGGENVMIDLSAYVVYYQ